MLRKAVAENLKDPRKNFRFRGHELKRIEAFSDAVFAFAVTLLIVSLEVPKSFEELMITIRGFIAFGIGFFFLMLIWYEQNIFFRRYGLDDKITVVLNCTLIFLVLFYVYPLKFLFSLMFSDQIYGSAHSPFVMEVHDLGRLMFIYGMGYIFIYVLFLLMYAHALKKKEQLELTLLEKFDTRTKIFSNTILILIGIISVITSQVVPPVNAGLAGMVYIIIGPALSIFFTYRGKKRRTLISSAPLNVRVL